MIEKFYFLNYSSMYLKLFFFKIFGYVFHLFFFLYTNTYVFFTRLIINDKITIKVIHVWLKYDLILGLVIFVLLYYRLVVLSKMLVL